MRVGKKFETLEQLYAYLFEYEQEMKLFDETKNLDNETDLKSEKWKSKDIINSQKNFKGYDDRKKSDPYQRYRSYSRNRRKSSTSRSRSLSKSRSRSRSKSPRSNGTRRICQRVKECYYCQKPGHFIKKTVEKGKIKKNTSDMKEFQM
jgi:hypothetical protein